MRPLRFLNSLNSRRRAAHRSCARVCRCRRRSSVIDSAQTRCEVPTICAIDPVHRFQTLKFIGKSRQRQQDVIGWGSRALARGPQRRTRRGRQRRSTVSARTPFRWLHVRALIVRPDEHCSVVTLNDTTRSGLILDLFDMPVRRRLGVCRSPGGAASTSHSHTVPLSCSIRNAFHTAQSDSWNSATLQTIRPAKESPSLHWTLAASEDVGRMACANDYR